MYDQIAENKRNTIILIVLFAGLIIMLSWLLGAIVLGEPTSGLFLGGIFLIGYSLVSYFFADKIILAISGARELRKDEYPYFFNLIDGLAIAAGIPKPKAYVINDTALNAFATGRDPEHGIIVATTGLLETMGRQELEGVIAHEMSHIKNYDIRLMTIIAVLVGVTALLSDVLLRSVLWGRNGRRSDGKGGMVLLVAGIALAVLTPVIATIIKLAVSRQREYLADASGALLTRNPDGLASALSKIGSDREVLEAANKATAHMYIDNPLKNRKSFFDSMFSTHPPIEDRVKRLRAM